MILVNCFEELVFLLGLKLLLFLSSFPQSLVIDISYFLAYS